VRFYWSTRAHQRIEELRREFAWLNEGGTFIITSDSGDADWWTFAGIKANATLANELAQILKSRVIYDSYMLTVAPSLPHQMIEQAVHKLQELDPKQMRPAVEVEVILGLKFLECLPSDVAVRMLQGRLQDPFAVEHTLHGVISFVTDY